MDIGNLPIFSGSKDKTSSSNSNQAPIAGNGSRSFDSNKKQAAPNEEKSAWEQIGDYDQPAAAASKANNHVDEDEDEEDHEQVQVPRKHTQTKDSKKESDDAASIASEAAVKATQQHSK
ncbi:hypothetical protein MAM1_0112c05598 [Mucor ambiguus]|uniref:Uncharacterized protein n=1 Tax=Mucor ambiguus TaxID=91626 RepID=A0A0C9M7L1_9FUNG|nr:hypothetical protein MAM1_0112c05598 [Mucor ambiguus]